MDRRESTHDDAERAERRALAKDADEQQAAGKVILIDESKAHEQVQHLMSTGVVEAVPDEQLLIHQPSGHAFKSDTALAYFHEGWTAREKR